ncbi:MAG: hypothetical protein DLM61_03195 [Pseudonocardiales bacterium]|nr:MAG: hypothetical protein DLM61_03195 [Pseudonocardiales bacterium]
MLGQVAVVNATLVRVTTVVAVVVVAVIAAAVSYSHMQQLADRAGEAWRSYLIPLSIDGLVVAASMVLLTRRRNGLPGGRLAWSALGGGVLASLAANMADARPQVTAVLVAGWPALAFAVAFELLLQQRRADNAAASEVALVPPDGPLSDPPATPAQATPTPTPLIAPALRPEPVVTTPALATQPLPESKPPARVSSTGVAPDSEPLETQLRGLIERTGRIPGRRTVAAELGITEHQARQLLDHHSPAPTGAALNGSGGTRQ